MKKKITDDPNELHQMNYRAMLEKYEYIARLAERARTTYVAVMDNRIYPLHWRRELDELREEQRKLGIKDSDFWPPAVRKRHGIVFKPGRRPRKPPRKNRKAA